MHSKINKIVEFFNNNNFPLYLIIGPVTVPMVSQSGSPPIPMPVQVPPGHVMQQIVDENGTLRHVFISTQHQQLQSGVQGVQHHIHGHYVSNIFLQLRFFYRSLYVRESCSIQTADSSWKKKFVSFTFISIHGFFHIFQYLYVTLCTYCCFEKKFILNTYTHIGVSYISSLTWRHFMEGEF
jgi:hypothetical protein